MFIKVGDAQPIKIVKDSDQDREEETRRKLAEAQEKAKESKASEK
jgi:hypothetical protein